MGTPPKKPLPILDENMAWRSPNLPTGWPPDFHQQLVDASS